jgi:cytochrome c biogenesis protein CcdA/thiol-disulfide isomerase/thioredoxin
MLLFAISYLAGMLTILSPCILPVLPFVFARAETSLLRGILPMLAGMALTFALVATLAAVGGSWVVTTNEIGRALAVVVLAVLGLSLLSPVVANIVAAPFVALGIRLSPNHETGEVNVGGSLLLGVATGLLWAPCAGPVLGLVLTGAALNGANGQTTLLLAAYAMGAATSLALAVLVGGRLLAVMKRSLGIGERIRQALGIAVLAGVVAIAFGFDTGALARLSYASTAGIEQSLLERFGASPAPVRQEGLALNNAPPPRYSSNLPVESALPALDGATTWLNSTPLSASSLRGKVVLVDFWTYSCINCIRALPYLRAWANKYRHQGLVVIGVHSPEFAFEKKIDNVKGAIDRFGITYPVAVDNDFRIWRAFRNNYWPALYFVDAEGRIRHHQFGEGGYERSEQVIRELLAEAAGHRSAQADEVAPHAAGAEAPPDLAALRSGETYLGYAQATGFRSPQGLGRDQRRDYTIGDLASNTWGLSGPWTITSDHAGSEAPDAVLAYRFEARDLHIVLGPSADGRPVRFRVTLDGSPPGADHGADTDADGYGVIEDTRLYQLVRQSGAVRMRRFEIRFITPGANAYAFTFG